MTTASLGAVADIADTRPFLCDILAKKLEGEVSYKLPITLPAFHNAILRRLLPFGILLLSTFPPLILLFGESLIQFANSNYHTILSVCIRRCKIYENIFRFNTNRK